MNDLNLKNIAENLIDAFLEAGKIAKEISRKGAKIVIKADKSPVTDGDLAVDKILKNKIKILTPKISIVSEETVNLDVKNDDKTFWLIDPIDGTKNFINGNGNFGTLISLCIDRSPVIGIINCPNIKKTWVGVKDNGAYCNGKKIKKSQNNLNLSNLYFSTSGMTAFKSNNKNKYCT